MNNKPVLIVFAGPNGSGKSSIIEKALENSELPPLGINPDLISKELSIGNLEAAKEAQRRRNDAIAARKSFYIETVMSTLEKVEMMRKAKEKGYLIRLEFITTQSPLINIERVHNRVKDGGHDVPEDKIVSRYERSMKLLPQAADVADVVLIHDNSSTESFCIAEKSLDGRWHIYPRPSHAYWNEGRIRKLMGLENVKNVETVITR